MPYNVAIGGRKMKADSAVIQNLIDAGCGKETISKFTALSKKEESSGQLKLLAEHRKTLLETLHVDQDKLNCLDYLIYKIRKQAEGKQ
jgi:hypothetical protein